MARRKQMTVGLEPDLRALLRLESVRSKRPMSELVREALRAYLAPSKCSLPVGAGAFDSGYLDTLDRHGETLGAPRLQ